MATGFYVYVHRRGDTGMPFYVGKGSGRRAHVDQHRNPHWRRVVAKAGYEVQIAVAGIDEELAHLAEMELIAKLRGLGLTLTNMTDGGEGMSGFRQSPETIARRSEKQRGQKRPSVSAKLKGRIRSPEQRARMSAANLGKTLSAEHRKKLSEAGKGRPSTMRGKKHSDEAKRKISAASAGEKNGFFGRKHSDASLQRMSETHTGFRHSEEARLKMSEDRRGAGHPMFGTKVSEDRKARQIASLKARPRVTCPHCARTMDESNAKRWHFDNCKESK